MKKLQTLIFLSLIVCSQGFSQQWSGPNNTTSTISRTGNIRIGQTLGLGTFTYLNSDNSSALYWRSSHSTASQMIFHDKENSRYGRVTGVQNQNGKYFGLFDGANNWMLQSKENAYVQFLVGGKQRFYTGNTFSRVRTQFGYLDIGPKSKNASHFQTDMPIFHFNKPASIMGALHVDNRTEKWDVIDMNPTKMAGGHHWKIQVRKTNDEDNVWGNAMSFRDVTSEKTPLMLSPRGDVEISGRLVVKGESRFSTVKTNPMINVWENEELFDGGADYAITYFDLQNPVTKNGFGGGKIELRGPGRDKNGNVIRDGDIILGITGSKDKDKNQKGRTMVVNQLNITPDGNFPDYVFEDTYSLMPLNELDQYIKDNGHLPNMPTAEEVEAEGFIRPAELHNKSIEKIEELTLYTLDQEKKIQDLEKQLVEKNAQLLQVLDRLDQIEKQLPKD